MAQMSEKRIILTVAIAGVVLAGAALGGVYWVQGKIEEETAKITTLDGQIAAADQKKQRIPKQEDEVIILRENIAEYVKILPPNSELTRFARTVNSFTQNSGVTLTHLTPTKASADKGSAFTRFKYDMRFTGTLWQFMKFMNMFESYKRFVKVTNFRLTAGRSAAGQSPDEIIHQFAMAVETYTYTQAVGGKSPVKIPSYEQKKARLREDIYRARQAIKIERYNFRGRRARRDIFIDPRIDRNNLISDGAPISEQLRELEEAIQELDGIRSKWKQAKETSVLIVRFEMRRDVTKRLDALFAKAEDFEARSFFTYQPYQLRFQREVRDGIDGLMKTVKGVKTGGPGSAEARGLPMTELVGIRRKVEDALNEGRLEDAIDDFELIRDKIEFPANDERVAIANRLREYYHKAKIAQEFSRLAIGVSGTIRLPESLSTAIINGKTFTEGDAIGDELFLKEVGEDYVEFLFKGVVLRRKQ